jgi:hypothetical protein
MINDEISYLRLYEEGWNEASMDSPKGVVTCLTCRKTRNERLDQRTLREIHLAHAITRILDPIFK